jgi:hypothetical protein
MSWRKNKESHWNGVDQIRHIAWISQDPFSCHDALFDLCVDIQFDTTNVRGEAKTLINGLATLKPLCARISKATFTFKDGVATITTRAITNFNDFMYKITEICSVILELKFDNMRVDIGLNLTTISIPFKMTTGDTVHVDAIIDDMHAMTIEPTIRSKRKRVDNTESILYINTFDMQTRDVIRHSDMYQVYQAYFKLSLDTTNRLLWVKDILPKIAYCIHEIKTQTQSMDHFIVVADDADGESRFRANNVYIGIFNMPAFSIDFIHSLMSLQTDCVITTFASHECTCLCIRYPVE